VLTRRCGERVAAGEPLAIVHGNDAARLDAELARITAAFAVGEAPVVRRPLAIERIPSNS
jgi:thymidine phosphorylase